MTWTRPEILNTVRDVHLKEMFRAMKYSVGTPNRGLLLKPTMKWDGDPNVEFEINGRSDSDLAKDPERRRSVLNSLLWHSIVVCDEMTKSRRIYGKDV
jgi:hypothetical protein